MIVKSQKYSVFPYPALKFENYICRWKFNIEKIFPYHGLSPLLVPAFSRRYVIMRQKNSHASPVIPSCLDGTYPIQKIKNVQSSVSKKSFPNSWVPKEVVAVEGKSFFYTYISQLWFRLEIDCVIMKLNKKHSLPSNDTAWGRILELEKDFLATDSVTRNNGNYTTKRWSKLNLMFDDPYFT